jgi:hypothetical protein
MLYIHTNKKPRISFGVILDILRIDPEDRPTIVPSSIRTLAVHGEPVHGEPSALESHQFVHTDRGLYHRSRNFTSPRRVFIIYEFLNLSQQKKW